MKRSMKILSIALSIAISFCFLVSCGPSQEDTSSDQASTSVSKGVTSQNEESTADTSGAESNDNASQKSSSTSTSSKKVTSNLFDVGSGKKSPDPLEQNIDLKGYEFTVVDFNSDTWSRKTGVSKSSDARIKIIKKVEEKLNCKIKFVNTTYGKYYSTYQSAMLSGEKVADVLCPTMYEVGSFISSGLLTDLKKVPNLHLDREYWNSNFSANTSIQNRVYAMSCALNAHLFVSNVVFFNKTVLKELGLKDQDLYEMVRKKEWTIDKFIELAKKAKKDIDGTAGFGSNDRYGLAAPNWAKSLALFLGSGIHLLKENKGKIEFNFKPTKSGAANTEVIKYLNKLKQVCVNGDVSNPVNANQKWEIAIDQFASDKALFSILMLGVLSEPDHSDKFLDMKSDFGVLPIPNAKKGDTYHNIVDWNSSAWIIPVTNKDLSKTGIILEALAYHSYYSYNSLHINEWCDKYLRDDDSVEMLSIIQKTPMYDHALLAGISDERISNIINKIIVPSAESAVGGYDPAQAIPMYEDTIRKGVDEFFNK